MPEVNQSTPSPISSTTVSSVGPTPAPPLSPSPSGTGVSTGQGAQAGVAPLTSTALDAATPVNQPESPSANPSTLVPGSTSPDAVQTFPGKTTTDKPAEMLEQHSTKSEDVMTIKDAYKLGFAEKLAECGISPTEANDAFYKESITGRDVVLSGTKGVGGALLTLGLGLPALAGLLGVAAGYGLTDSPDDFNVEEEKKKMILRDYSDVIRELKHAQ